VIGPLLGLALGGWVYAMLWGLVWLAGRVVSVPPSLRWTLPWLLFQTYIVGGLFVTGDLPGAPAAVLKFISLVGGFSLVFGVAARYRQGEAAAAGPAAWLAAGLGPWLIALAAEWL